MNMISKRNEAAEAASTKAYELLLAIDRDKDGNPITLDGAIRSVILKNPTIAEYRTDALGIIYCVLGSGIAWRNGRLSDTHANNYMNPPPAAGGQGCWTEDHGIDESLKRMVDSFADPFDPVSREIEKIQRRFENSLRKAIDTVYEIDERCQRYRPGNLSWYPISWYGCNLCAPLNAQEDFLNGAIETATLICQTRPTIGTERWIVHQQTRGYASQILKLLMARKEAKPKKEP